MELPGDVNRFVQWLAAAMGGGEHLLALFHKPSVSANIPFQRLCQLTFTITA